MKLLGGFTVACLIVASGCSSTRIDADTEERASRHMAVADSMEQAHALDQATLEYQIVAELYPTSSAYPTAVREASLLFMNPENPSHNDSLALHWTSMYLALPVQWSERESARAQLNLLERIAALQQDLDRRRRTSDSLATVVRKQDTQLAGQAQQLQALQNELKQVHQELDKLKQVDVQINKSRRK
jgi:hypothetical protein